MSEKLKPWAAWLWERRGRFLSALFMAIGGLTGYGTEEAIDSFQVRDDVELPAPPAVPPKPERIKIDLTPEPYNSANDET